MKPVKSVRLQFGELLAADATTLAPAADANKMALVKAEFNDNEDLVAGDLTLADFNGSTPIIGAVGSQLVGTDPVTGDQKITIKDPAGGYRWEVGSTLNLPQTIYGRVLLSNDLADLIAYELFDQPITLTAVGQEINPGPATMVLVSAPVS